MECLIAIAKNGSINKASLDLFTTPQNVSKLLKQIEDEMEFKIVIRKASGATFTKLGLEVLEASYDTLQRFEAIKQKNKDEQKKIKQIEGEIQLHCISAHNLFFLDDFVDKFVKQYPKISVNYICNTEYGEIYTAIEEDPIRNIGILPFSYINEKLEIEEHYLQEYEFEILLQDKMVLLCSKDFKYAHTKKISVKKLKDCNLVMVKESSKANSLILNALKKYGIYKEDLTYTVRSPFNFLSYIKNGMGVGMMQKNTLIDNAAIALGKILVIEFEEDFSVCNCIVTSKSIEYSRVQRLFLDELYRYFDK